MENVDSDEIFTAIGSLLYRKENFKKNIYIWIGR